VVGTAVVVATVVRERVVDAAAQDAVAKVDVRRVASRSSLFMSFTVRDFR
jgi:hypothetical protein